MAGYQAVCGQFDGQHVFDRNRIARQPIGNSGLGYAHSLGERGHPSAYLNSYFKRSFLRHGRNSKSRCVMMSITISRVTLLQLVMTMLGCQSNRSVGTNRGT